MLSQRVAGALYLAMLVTGVFAGFASGNAAVIANVVTCAGDVALVAALYILLRTTHRNAASPRSSSPSARRSSTRSSSAPATSPRALAALGIFASLVVLIVQSIGFAGMRIYRTNLLVIAFELAAGVWLLFNGRHA